MRVLGVDWGSVRIGVALGENPPAIATARPPLKATGSLKKDAEQIAALAKKEEAELIVVGLPVHDGDDRGVRLCRTLAGRLEALGMKVDTMDEAFTTHEAHDALRDLGYSAAQRKRQVDGESACRILVRYFENS